ncbi:tRNA threonylcarbamoyladenosine biosynthesis protein TsaB [Saccharicrinis carchari]|uniref:tRNA threonylcarbamoyladenosine biosynthesis protein TsaB n=1 Tax=Saccharicrinis carchari TaxID=1168039 RepID=A0A521EIU2_SACCC|nr:tRNA (adenosine(37)-N6)-threonylcarbamoyltransferase complex dimerization subunit type 1 TsaB [Saccharicrinis carchari]SMO83381.1 tRNA threonylcarbamoyladenosine biosynthesis protein TsaB [Saccharicrinis carchari]
MALILSLETSTKVCSVCLSDKQTIVAKKQLFEANSHATHLTLFIQNLFNELPDLSMKDIDAVAVSSGPGSYTGLRIGVSVAKGICYALAKPLIAISSLECLAQAAIAHPDLQNIVDTEMLYCPMIDARRMEVYTALFDSAMNLKEKVSARIIDSSSYLNRLNKHTIVFFGDGSDKCRGTIEHSNAVFIKDLAPLASNMAGLAYKKYQNKQFEDLAYFEPFYLKNFVATVSKNKIF